MSVIVAIIVVLVLALGIFIATHSKKPQARDCPGCGGDVPGTEYLAPYISSYQSAIKTYLDSANTLVAQVAGLGPDGDSFKMAASYPIDLPSSSSDAADASASIVSHAAAIQSRTAALNNDIAPWSSSTPEHVMMGADQDALRWSATNTGDSDTIKGDLATITSFFSTWASNLRSDTSSTVAQTILSPAADQMRDSINGLSGTISALLGRMEREAKTVVAAGKSLGDAAIYGPSQLA